MSTVILACTTLLDAVEKAQEAGRTSYEVIELDRQYHVDPAQMREHVLSTLEKLPEEVDTVLIAMGLCGGSLHGVSSGKTLVIPRVADCVALALVTPDEFRPDLKKAGHMYLFGDGKSGFSMQSIYDELHKNYDPETADDVFEMYFEHYNDLDVIENGVYDCYSPYYVEKARHDADLIGARLNYVKGSNVLLEKLVSGDWDERFVVIKPGEKVNQDSFF